MGQGEERTAMRPESGIRTDKERSGSDDGLILSASYF